MHLVGQRSNFLDDVELAPVATGVGAGIRLELAGDVGLHFVLVDADVVFPGADDREVGAGDGGHAAVRTAVELELELVGEGRAVQLVLVVVGQGVADVLGVVAGEFAARLAQTVGRGAQVAAGAAEVRVELVGQVIEDLFELRGDGAQHDHVAGGAVHVGQARAAQFPDVADAAQVFGVVELAGRLVDAHGVEMGDTREFFGLVAVTADDAAAVAEHAHDAAVLPMGLFFLEGQLQDTQQILGAIGRCLIVDAFGVFRPEFRLLLNVGHEAGPRAAFQLVQQRGRVFRHCHPPVRV